MSARVPITVILIALAVAGSNLAAQEVALQEPVVHETVDVNGFTMAYRDVGSGEALVLLHGFTETGRMWDPVLETFAERYRVIVPDLRGHGRSTNPDGTFTHRQAARDVFALLDHLGVDGFRGMGGSTGAMTLLHMATAWPERVEAMVLIAGTTYFPEQAREIMRGVPEELPQEQLEEQAERTGHVRGAEQMGQLLTLFRNFQHSYDDMNFTPPYLSTIQAPTLIVHGDRDEFFPVSIAVQMYESIPDSYLWVLPNTGHDAGYWSERGRARIVETTLDFLAGRWQEREQP